MAGDGGHDLAPSAWASAWAVACALGSVGSSVTAIRWTSSGRSARPVEAIAIAKRPPSSRRCAELPTVTWCGAVWESEQNTIACAPSCSASARSPSGVERSETT